VENVAAFLSFTKESHIMPAPQLITTDCGVHWILLTKENGEIVVSVYLARILPIWKRQKIPIR